MKLTFKLTSETKISGTGETLYRIEAIQDIPAIGVKKGDKGGFVSSETVDGYARVSGNAQVSGNARVYGNAQVYGNAWVSGPVHVDALGAIIVLVVVLKYSVTVTRKHVQIGCQLFKRSEILKITKEQAVEKGFPAELYDGYCQMIKGAMKLVKRSPDKKEI